MNFNHHDRNWWAVWVAHDGIFPWDLGKQWDEAHAENAARANSPLNPKRPPILCASAEEKDEVVARLKRELHLPVI